MNEISPDQLLSQIKTMSRSLQSPQVPVEPQAAGFGDLLRNTLDSVNEAQQTSKKMKTDFVNGTGDASLAEVMIAAQKANLSFRAVTEVRNKLVQAYQDIMNMPV